MEHQMSQANVDESFKRMVIEEYLTTNATDGSVA